MEQNFDQFAKDYRNTHTKSIKAVAGADSFYFARHKVMELARFEKNNSQKFLDFGCGDGVTETYISSQFPSFSITGLDISNESIVIANKKEIPNCTFLWFDGVSIPFPDNTFHIVFIAGVLHHVPLDQRQNLVNEIVRVLQPGGRLYLFEHNPYNPLTKYLVNTCVFDRGVQLLKAKESGTLLRKAGLKILDNRYVIFFPRGRFFKWLHKTESMLAHFPLGGQYYFRAIKEVSNPH
jgi:ubiquinone/menaquinone biosynthesis C-methylase UbiE